MRWLLLCVFFLVERELISCDLLQFIVMYYKKKEFHSCNGMKPL